MMRSLVCVFLLSLSTSSFVFAAEVVKVKGKSALLDMKGDPAVPGDTFYAVKPDGKRAAIIRISKVKGDKAIGKVTKGKAAAGYTLEFKPAKVPGQMQAKEKTDSSGQPTAHRSYWGGVFGYSQTSWSVNVNDANDELFETIKMSGGGFSAKALFDYELFPQVWFRGSTGLEGISGTGPAKCGEDNTGPCDVSIYYLSMDFIGRYVFSNGTFRPWLGGGVELLIPASKKATAIAESSISTSNVIVVAGGFDWFTSPNLYIPITLEYGMLPKSDEVEATWIAFRVGFAVPF
jgi:hypothetical protein